MYEMEGPHRFPASLTALPIARVRREFRDGNPAAAFLMAAADPARLPGSLGVNLRPKPPIRGLQLLAT
ncbi:hypothetical protein JOD67_001506 [Tenggerimyces flavus]|nr:hypothetical protein [Tenggerimyces flavus]